MQYIVTCFPIRFTKEDIPQLVSETQEINGIIQVIQDNLVASAKHSIGLSALDYDKPMDMLIQAYLTDEQIKTFKKYRRKNHEC